MLNLECDKVIFNFLQNFYTSIISTHSDHVKECMQNIVSLFWKGDVDICKVLRAKLLTIWRKEPIILPNTYDLVEKLVTQNKKVLRRVLTKKELRRIDGGERTKTGTRMR